MRRRWLSPIVLLSGAAVSAFGLFYTVDRVLVGGGGPLDFFDFAPERITDAVGSLSSMIAAVLGIIVTVVSIVVQLSAERYTKVTEMFFRDRTNLLVLAFYVVGCMCGIFVSFSLGTDFVPRFSLVAMIAIALVGFATMAPYFAYVFDFLQPENIIRRIREKALAAVVQGDQEEVVSGMEQLTDIVVNSVSSKDKLIATAGVDALRDLARSYLGLKGRLGASWFDVGPGIARNPDFVSIAAESRAELILRRTWVEWKVLRQYQAIYGEALGSMRDINCVVAIDTRYVGEEAIARGDREVLELVIKFFNTYLRATLNARDVRTAYNVLYQYRQLAEAILRARLADLAEDVAGYIKYYGHVSFQMNLAFVTETVAYDLCALCELAHAERSPAEPRLLRTFLEVDQAGEGESQETGLRGVRKAQVKLATYYLASGAEALARVIYEDMKHERPERLTSIREELEQVESKDFWEIIDRGTNFDYLPPERKAQLEVFFSWFERDRDIAKEAVS